MTMYEFWILLYLFPILTATVQNSIILILHISKLRHRKIMGLVSWSESSSKLESEPGRLIAGCDPSYSAAIPLKSHALIPGSSVT